MPCPGDGLAWLRHHFGTRARGRGDRKRAVDRDSRLTEWLDALQRIPLRRLRRRRADQASSDRRAGRCLLFVAPRRSRTASRRSSSDRSAHSERATALHPPYHPPKHTAQARRDRARTIITSARGRGRHRRLARLITGRAERRLAAAARGFGHRRRRALPTRHQIDAIGGSAGAVPRAVRRRRRHRGDAYAQP